MKKGRTSVILTSQDKQDFILKLPELYIKGLVFLWEDRQFDVVNIQNAFLHRLCCSVVKAEIEPGYE